RCMGESPAPSATDESAVPMKRLRIDDVRVNMMCSPRVGMSPWGRSLPRTWAPGVMLGAPAHSNRYAARRMPVSPHDRRYRTQSIQAPFQAADLRCYAPEPHVAPCPVTRTTSTCPVRVWRRPTRLGFRDPESPHTSGFQESCSPREWGSSQAWLLRQRRLRTD